MVLANIGFPASLGFAWLAGNNLLGRMKSHRNCWGRPITRLAIGDPQPPSASTAPSESVAPPDTGQRLNWIISRNRNHDGQPNRPSAPESHSLFSVGSGLQIGPSLFLRALAVRPRPVPRKLDRVMTDFIPRNRHLAGSEANERDREQAR